MNWWKNITQFKYLRLLYHILHIVWCYKVISFLDSYLQYPTLNYPWARIIYLISSIISLELAIKYFFPDKNEK